MRDTSAGLSLAQCCDQLKVRYVKKTGSKQDVSIRQYALRAREQTLSDFDDKNKSQLDIALATLQKILVLKLLVVSRGCDFKTMAHYEAFALTKSALDVLVSALHMARQRAVVETITLLRVALECGATALHISHDSDACACYKEGEYHSTKATAFAKKFVPVFGEIWGTLSEMAVHINLIGFGPKMKPGNKGELIRKVVLEYGCRKHQPVQDQVALTLISLVATIILKITELILFERSKVYEGALQLVGTQTIYMSNTDAKILEYNQELRLYAHK